MLQFSWLTAALLVVAILLAVALVMLFQNPAQRTPLADISYSQLLKMGPKLQQAVIRDDTLEGRDADGFRFRTELPHDPTIATRLAEAGTEVSIVTPRDGQDWRLTLATSLLPIAIYFILFGIPLFRIARAVETLAQHGTGS